MSSWEDFRRNLRTATSPGIQKQMIGEKLYARITHLSPEWAAKITGMMLEMDNNSLIAILEEESNRSLHSKVNEALEILDPLNTPKQMIGEKLHARITHLSPEWAAKITGMMLELDNNSLLAILEEESNRSLHSKVNEALEILDPLNKLPRLPCLVATLHPSMDDVDSVTIRCTNISGAEIAVLSVEPWRTMDSVRKTIAQAAQIPQHDVELIGQDAQVYDDKCYVAEILPAGSLPASQILGWLTDLLEDAPWRKAALSQLLPLVAKWHDAEGIGQRKATINAEPKGKDGSKGSAQGG